MLEIPESNTIARQLNDKVQGRIISYVEANKSPHSFAWYFADPLGYNDLLSGKKIGKSYARSGMVEVEVEECRLLLADGATIRYYDDLSKVPKKHQLYVEFDDATALVVTIQMYGGIWAFREGTNDNKYYQLARQKPSPLTESFDYEYFSALLNDKERKLSAKAFLATEQRIPGLGNGVLQDILYLAEIHPKRKMKDVTEEEFRGLFDSVKDVLTQMTKEGGRDTEKDLFGNNGNYMTYLSKKTYGTPCPRCGYEIRKASYLGGTIYYCEQCQK